MDTGMTAAERRHNMKEFIEALKGLTDQVKTFDSNQMLIIKRLDDLEKTSDEHQEILVDGSKGGLVSTVLILKDRVASLTKILWIEISLITGGVAVWLGQIIISHFSNKSP